MSHAATLLLAACPLLAALAGCGAGPARETTIASRAPTAESLSVRGFLDYDDKIALPQDGFAIVELRDTSPPRAVIAEQRVELLGQSLPLKFELLVDRALLASDRSYAVRGAIKQGAKALWATDPVVIDMTSAPGIDIGTQEMKPVVVVAFGSDFDCGDQRITIGMAGDLLRIIIGDSHIDMQPVVAASGMKYEAVGDPTTVLWSQERRASLTLRGNALHECVWVSSPE